MTRTQRTPQEIIAETEAKLSRLRVKQAKQEALSNPAAAPLLTELEDLRKDIHNNKTEETEETEKKKKMKTETTEARERATKRKNSLV